MIKLNMPKDARAYVLESQAKKRSEKLGQFSQEQTIIAIIREHKEAIDLLQNVLSIPHIDVVHSDIRKFLQERRGNQNGFP